MKSVQWAPYLLRICDNTGTGQAMEAETPPASSRWLYFLGMKQRFQDFTRRLPLSGGMGSNAGASNVDVSGCCLFVDRIGCYETTICRAGTWRREQQPNFLLPSPSCL